MSGAGRSSSWPGRRGQPLFFLLGIVLAWAGLRALFWELPFDRQVRVTGDRAEEFVTAGDAIARQPAKRAWEPAPVRESRLPRLSEPIPRTDLSSGSSAVAQGNGGRGATELPVRSGTGHNLLWMAAMGSVPVPERLVSLLPVDLYPRDRRDTGHARRLSLDSWLFLREGGERLVNSGPRAASYGRSQAGAVLRYRLRPSSRHAPSAYLRASRALVADGASELALGVSTRPFARLPLAAHVEARVTRQTGRTELRPAAFVTAGVDRARLPFGLEARGYAQAGYVGGDFATAFADGGLVADRELARFDLGLVRAGAGAWGGAQKGAARLDIGPSASLELTLEEAPVRLSLDYRVRVAGDAAPASGAALTLSTGF